MRTARVRREVLAAESVAPFAKGSSHMTDLGKVYFVKSRKTIKIDN